jgi:uncharacterized delta-60 repeat protein
MTLPVGLVRAAPGDLDTSFGAPNGFVLFPMHSIFTDVAVQPTTGKILAVGLRDSGSGRQAILVRFNTDGTLDSSFAIGGVATGPTESFFSAIALQPDGKIVAAGIHVNTGALFARYDANGNPDPSFGQGGLSILPENVPTRKIAVGPGGTIVAADTALPGDGGGPPPKVVVARLISNGDLDTSFGSGGIVANEVGLAFDVALLGSGQILVAGASGIFFALWRYNTNGTLDTSFGGGDGVATAAVMDASNALATSLAVQPDGRIVLAGGANVLVSSVGALARFDSNGSLDPTFGVGGTATSNLTDTGYLDLAIQSDGAIIAGGNSSQPGTQRTLLSRFNSNGSPDLSFGTSGNVVTTTFPGILQFLRALAIQSDGRVVIAGDVLFSTCCANQNSGLVARYNGNGAPPPPPPPSFDICLQNDMSNAGKLIFKFNSSTGAYEFRDCSKGFVLTGTGTITVNSCKLELLDLGPVKPSDRTVSVQVNTCTKKATVSITIKSPSKMYGFTDNDITQGSCTCP